MRISLISVVVFLVLLLIEVMAVSLFTGYLPDQISSRVLQNPGFFLSLFREQPFDTLYFLLLQTPVLVIESHLDESMAVIWGWHLYSYTIVTHAIVAVLIGRVLNGNVFFSALKRIPWMGAGLLLFSSWYLFLGSCCSGGASWVLQTLSLAWLFNPVNASQAALEIYTQLQKWFFVSQVFVAATSILLLLRYKRNQVPVTPLNGNRNGEGQ